MNVSTQEEMDTFNGEMKQKWRESRLSVFRRSYKLLIRTSFEDVSERRPLVEIIAS
jgi:hypothetical protein